MKILIVDDDPNVRELCRVVLGREGYEVLEAVDGPAGMNQAIQHQPALIMLDWMMPGVDGIDTLRALKGHPRTREIPVVMLTALDGLAEITVATHSGADGYLTKPFDVRDLLALAHRHGSTGEA